MQSKKVPTLNMKVADYCKTLVTICHSQGVTFKKSMTFKDDITIIIKSQEFMIIVVAQLV